MFTAKNEFLFSYNTKKIFSKRELTFGGRIKIWWRVYWVQGGGGGGGAVFPGWERMSKFKASEGTHHHPPQ